MSTPPPEDLLVMLDQQMDRAHRHMIQHQASVPDLERLSTLYQKLLAGLREQPVIQWMVKMAPVMDEMHALIEQTTS